MPSPCVAFVADWYEYAPKIDVSLYWNLPVYKKVVFVVGITTVMVG